MVNHGDVWPTPQKLGLSRPSERNPERHAHIPYYGQAQDTDAERSRHLNSSTRCQAASLRQLPLRRSPTTFPARCLKGAIPAWSTLRVPFPVQPIDVGTSSWIGQRSTNQDRVYADQSTIALFDGIGGRAIGEVAATLALAETLRVSAIDRVSTQLDVLRCLQQADHTVATFADELGVSIGTTAVVVLFFVTGRRLSCQLGWAGDSTALLVRDEGIVDLTAAPPETDPAATIYHGLTSWIGTGDHRPPTAAEHSLYPGDILILVSDGVTDVLDPAEIGRIVIDSDTAQDAATAVTSVARDRVTKDNASAVVARVRPGDQTSSSISFSPAATTLTPNEAPAVVDQVSASKLAKTEWQ